MNKHPIKNQTLAIDRLELFINAINVSKRQFENNIGVANGYICNQIRRRGSISSGILNKILINYPELNVIWLLTGHSLIIPRQQPANQTFDTALVAR